MTDIAKISEVRNAMGSRLFPMAHLAPASPSDCASESRLVVFAFRPNAEVSKSPQQHGYDIECQQPKRQVAAPSTLANSMRFGDEARPWLAAVAGRPPPPPCLPGVVAEGFGGVAAVVALWSLVDAPASH